MGNGKRKKRIFLSKKFQESKKIMETDRKFSQFRMGKGRKNYSDEAKKSQKTDDPDEKAADFFAGGRENAEKNGEKKQKNLSNHPKKA